MPTSSFDDAYQIAVIDILNVVGVDAIFTPITGQAVECKVDLIRAGQNQAMGLTGQALDMGTTIEAALSVIGRVPVQGDVFEIVGEASFTVVGIFENDGFTVKVAVV